MENPNFKSSTLILGSSFFKEYVLLGELLKVNDKINLNEFDNYISTSTCSIIILLLSIGKTVPEIIYFFYESDFLINMNQLLKERCSDELSEELSEELNGELRNQLISRSNDELNSGSNSNINSKYDCLGIKAKLIDYIESEISIVPTLEQLYLMTGKNITFLCEKNGDLVEISHINYPNLLCTEAVIFSLTIPSIYEQPQFLTIYKGFCDCTHRVPLALKYATNSDLVVSAYLYFSNEKSNNITEDLLKKLINSKIERINKKYGKNSYKFCSTIPDFNIEGEDVDIIKNDILVGYSTFREV